MSDKPLHVRVAEALGCPVRLVNREQWGCPCKNNEHGEWHEGMPNYFFERGREDTATLLRYDTSWEATGPLIEKYRITVWAEKWERGWEAFYEAEDTNDGVVARMEALGSTPLIAVCNLILALKESGKLDLDKSS